MQRTPDGHKLANQLNTTRNKRFYHELLTSHATTTYLTGYNPSLSRRSIPHRRDLILFFNIENKTCNASIWHDGSPSRKKLSTASSA
jgi:hypothetical protein